jgi:3'-phosphoadenosine 5'-phosphosulfate sulfotransferase (PAPS reductase)/FAD synthetase
MDKTSAYRIDGPALVSFSGGRTSAYMLHQIIQAWDGQLPDDVKVAFANTGKEREETLRFVHECGSRWGVQVRWLEWRRFPPYFEEVGYNSASRSGEPFAALIAKKKTTPNALRRFCTGDLKVEPIKRFCQSLGWHSWTNIVGLRYDEGVRVLKALDRNENSDRPWRDALPLSKAKVTKADVMAFWSAQPFDLGLKPYEGNCDLCFLRKKATNKAIIRADVSRADWWMAQEVVGNGSFVTEYSYADLVREVRNQGDLFDGFLPDIEEHDAECGLFCAA